MAQHFDKRLDIWQNAAHSRKNKPGEPIPVTARQLESFMLEHDGRFNSSDYDKFECMKLMEPPVRDAIHELKTDFLETPARRFDERLFGRGKRVFCEVGRRRRQLALLFPRIHV